MNILVGSENPIKVAAVCELCADYPHLKNARVKGVSVSSGISDQPLSYEEIVRGAQNRARGAFRGCDYSVGIESGFMPVRGARSGYIEYTIAAVCDGDVIHLGSSGGFECPDSVMRYVREGCDLSEACWRAGLTDTPDVGSKGGIISILSRGRIDRKAYTKQALQMAFIHIDT